GPRRYARATCATGRARTGRCRGTASRSHSCRYAATRPPRRRAGSGPQWRIGLAWCHGRLSHTRQHARSRSMAGSSGCAACNARIVARNGGESMEISGRSVLVTGGAHRVGRALSVALADAGMRVAINYNAASAEADALVRELSARGHDCRGYKADLTQPEAPRSLVESVTRDFGGLDVLINSAAVMRRTPVDDVTVAEWDSMFALNLRAPFFLAQAARPHLRSAKGCIVNLADLAAFETWPEYIPHGISKAGVVQMTRALAHAFAPDVRVNAIAPGAVLLP